MRFSNLVTDLRASRKGEDHGQDTSAASPSNVDISMSDVAVAKALMIRHRRGRYAITRVGPDSGTDDRVESSLSAPGMPLWLEAYTSLPVAETKHLPSQALTANAFSDVLVKINEKKVEMERKQWTFVRKNGEKVPIRRFVDSISRYAKKFQDIGDVVVQYDPVHAALPWAGVRVLLQLVIGDSQVYGAMLEGLEYASYIISSYSENAIYAMLGDFAAIEQLQSSLVRLYAAVLRYLNKAYQYYSQHSAERTLRGAFTAQASSLEAIISLIRREEERVYKALDLLQTENLKKGVFNKMDDLTMDIRGMQSILLDPPVSPEQQREKFFKWLKPTFTEDELDTALRRRLDGTCDWILEHESFVRWLASEEAVNEKRSKFFWLHSPAGFGKTVLSSRIIKHLQECTDHDVAFFHCTSADESKRNPYSILRSWIAQIIKINDNALYAAREPFEQHQERPPTISELWTLFKIVTKENPEVLFVIDGYDECLHADQNVKFQTRDIRAQFIQELSENIVNPSRILMTSREDMGFRTELNQGAALGLIKFTEYRILPSDTQQDIKKVSTKLIGAKLANRSQKLREDIADKAAVNSRGMFLMVDLWLKNKLKPSKNEKALRAAVEEMPMGFEAAYQRDVDKLKLLDEEDREQVLVMLRLMVYSVRPLRVMELIEAMAVATNEDEEYPVDQLPDTWSEGYLDEDQAKEQLLEHCASLVEIRESEDDISRRTVHFSHFTVKEFLLKNPLLNQVRNPRASGDEWFAMMCMQYLCYEPFQGMKTDDPELEAKLAEYPFFQYAFSNWIAHVSELNPISDEVFQAAVHLFTNSISSSSFWPSFVDAKTYDPDPDQGFDIEIQNRADWQRYPPEGSYQRPERTNGGPVYMAAVCGLTNLVKRLCEEGYNPQLPGGRFGSPLQAAAVQGKAETAIYLIDAGVDVNQHGGVFGSALNAACEQGLDDVALRLLERGADVEALSPGGRTALHFACHRSSLKVIERLIDCGADYDAVSHTGEIPITRACASGRLEIMKFLVDKYNGQLPRHRGGWDLLRIAIVHKRDDLVRYLVDAGADVNYDKSSKTDLTSLHTAANVSSPEIVSLLLENGATSSINRISPKAGGGSALALALSYNNEPIEVSKILIKHGANINERSQDGYTPLHLALSDVSYVRDSSTWLDVIQFCLDQGADTKAKTVHGETPLQYMLRAGDAWTMDMLRALVEASPDLREGEQAAGWSLIACVGASESSSNWRECIELLVQRGADLNFGTTDATPPIHTIILSNKPQLERLKFLLDLGANINQAWRNQTPLHFAAIGGHEDIVQELVARGAELNICDEQRSPPLHAAIYHGRLNVVKLLLDRGASVEAPEPRSFDAISASLHSPTEEINIFRLLAGRTADVRQFDSEGDSAITEILMHGIKRQKAKHADILIEHGAFIPRHTTIDVAGYRRKLVLPVRLKKHAFHAEAEKFHELYPEMPKEERDSVLDSLVLAAAAGGEPSIVEKLLDDGAHIECQILSGRTPLQLAVTCGSLELTRLLLSKGANPQAKDLVGTNVLQQASRVQGQDVEIIHVLTDGQAMAEDSRLAEDNQLWQSLVGEWKGETRSTERPLNPSQSKPFTMTVTASGLIPTRRRRRFEGTGNGEGDEFYFVGQVLVDGEIRFARVCKRLQGALHVSKFDASTMTIEGLYGVNENTVDGTFSLKKEGC